MEKKDIKAKAMTKALSKKKGQEHGEKKPFYASKIGFYKKGEHSSY